MQQVTSPSVDKLPKIGYYVSQDEKKEKFYQTESHIHKQNALSGIKAGAHKLTNDIFTYLPKGLQGSKNSDFYEFLSFFKKSSLSFNCIIKVVSLAVIFFSFQGLLNADYYYDY